MKRLSAILIVALLAACGWGATVTFNLTDFLTTVLPLQKKTVVLIPESTPRTNGTTVVVSERRYFAIGTNGSFVATNMVYGNYLVDVWGLTYTSRFRILVPNTNVALNASDLLVTTNSVPSESAGYTQSAANNRFVLRNAGWSSNQTITNLVLNGSTNAFQHTNGAVAGYVLTTDGTNGYWLPAAGGSGAGPFNANQFASGGGITNIKSGAALTNIAGYGSWNFLIGIPYFSSGLTADGNIDAQSSDLLGSGIRAKGDITASNLQATNGIRLLPATPFRIVTLDVNSRLTNTDMRLASSLAGATAGQGLVYDSACACWTNSTVGGSGEINVNNEISVTNATRIGLVYDKSGVSNRLRSIQGGYAIVLTNQSTNIMIAVDQLFQNGSATLTNLSATGAITNLTSDQFTGPNIWAIKSGALLTNLTIRGANLPSLSASFIAYIDANGNLTNSIFGTSTVQGSSMVLSNAVGSGVLTNLNANQFTIAAISSIKNGALLTNLQIYAASVPLLTASRPVIIDASGNLTNATGTPDGTKFLRDDGTLAVPAGSGTPGGISGDVQFNETGVFAGTNTLSYDRTNNALFIGSRNWGISNAVHWGNGAGVMTASTFIFYNFGTQTLAFIDSSGFLTIAAAAGLPARIGNPSTFWFSHAWVTNGMFQNIVDSNLTVNRMLMVDANSQITNTDMRLASSLAGVSDGQGLVYNSACSCWTNATVGGSGEVNINNEISVTNATRMGWVYDKSGVSNRLRSVQGGYAIVLTNESTNIMIAVDQVFQIGSTALTNFAGMVNATLTNIIATGALTNLNANQFTVAALSSIKNGALLTNISVRGETHPALSASFLAYIDASGNLTNSIFGTSAVQGSSMVLSNIVGSGSITNLNSDQFTGPNIWNLKSGALLTNLSIRGVTLPSLSASFLAYIDASGNLTNSIFGTSGVQASSMVLSNAVGSGVLTNLNANQFTVAAISSIKSGAITTNQTVVGVLSVSNNPGTIGGLRLGQTNGFAYTEIAVPDLWLPTNRIVLTITNPVADQVMKIQAVSASGGITTILLTNGPDNNSGGAAATNNVVQSVNFLNISNTINLSVTNVTGTNIVADFNGPAVLIWQPTNVGSITITNIPSDSLPIERRMTLMIYETGAVWSMGFTSIWASQVNWQNASGSPLLSAGTTNTLIIVKSGTNLLGYSLQGPTTGTTDTNVFNVSPTLHTPTNNNPTIAGATAASKVRFDFGTTPTVGQVLTYHSFASGEGIITNGTAAAGGGSTQMVTAAIGVLTMTNQILLISQQFNGSNGVSAVNLTNNLDMALSIHKAVTNVIGTNLVYQLSNVAASASFVMVQYGNGSTTQRVSFTVPSGGTNIYWVASTNGTYDIEILPSQVYSITAFADRQTNIVMSWSTTAQLPLYAVNAAISNLVATNVVIRSGGSVSNAFVGGRLYASLASLTNCCASGATNMHGYTFAAHTMTNLNDELLIKTDGRFSTTGQSKEILIDVGFGGTTTNILDTGLQAISNGTWNAWIRLIRRDAVTVHYDGSIVWDRAVVGGGTNISGELTQFTNGLANYVQIRGQANVVSAITNTSLTVDWIPGPR